MLVQMCVTLAPSVMRLIAPRISKTRRVLPDQNSLGTSHCASAVGKYQNESGQVHDGFIRGCIDCADKKAACFALGGALKARKFWILQQCEIECCTGSNCNTQTPTLTQAAITVFKPGAGPKHCHACAERDEATCTANQQNQTCATDQNSLGTTHCGSAAGKYQDEFGQVHNGFIRGCIDCADKKTACFALGGALKARKFWTILQCEIECCTSNDCSTQTPTLSKNVITVFTPEGNTRNTQTPTLSHGSTSRLFSAGVFALALAFGHILYHF